MTIILKSALSQAKTAALLGGMVGLAITAFSVASIDNESPTTARTMTAYTPTRDSSSITRAGSGGGTGAITVFNFELDWPANGTAYAPQSTDRIRGLSSVAGVPVTVYALTANGSLGELLGQTTASTVPSLVGAAGGANAYEWSMPAKVPTGWDPNGGSALRLVAIASPNPFSFNASGIPLGFDVDSSQCLAAQYPARTWTSAAMECRSLFPLYTGNFAPYSAGATVLSTRKTPGDMPYGQSPRFISLVEPTKEPSIGSSIPNQTTNGDIYYTLIGARTKFSEFIAYYGFDPDGRAPYNNGEIEATYYNHGDLGLGRNMHCKRFSHMRYDQGYPFGKKMSGMACYVGNYAEIDAQEAGPPPVNFGKDESFALNAAIDRTPNNHAASVAMVQYDYSDRMDFMVYNNNGLLAPEVQFNKNSDNRVVPTNCQSCHGGTYSDPRQGGTGIASGANFLPFDSDDRILRFSTRPGFTKADQASKIRDLNMLIYNLPQTKESIKKHIRLMYGGNENASAPGPVYTENAVPTTWQDPARPDKAKLYREVVRPYCTGCHAGSANALIESYANFESSKAAIMHAVCVKRDMPNAQQTSENFWKSPARAYLLNAFATPGTACNP